MDHVDFKNKLGPRGGVDKSIFDASRPTKQKRTKWSVTVCLRSLNSLSLLKPWWKGGNDSEPLSVPWLSLIQKAQLMWETGNCKTSQFWKILAKSQLGRLWTKERFPVFARIITAEANNSSCLRGREHVAQKKGEGIGGANKQWKLPSSYQTRSRERFCAGAQPAPSACALGPRRKRKRDQLQTQKASTCV